MSEHRFKVGDLVRIVGASSLTPLEGFVDRHAPRGVQGTPDDGLFEVMQLLPAVSNGDLQYRIRSSADARERIVRERQLSPAVELPPSRTVDTP